MSAAPLRRRPAPSGHVVDLSALRIARVLARRSRYRYVAPRVEREGPGWRIVSPNCSRNIDPAGGEIAIAWLVPGTEGLWQLHGRDHAAQCWRAVAAGLTLEQALQQVCDDPLREFWP
jgi:hypothetical protein